MNRMWSLFKWRPTEWFVGKMDVYKSIMTSRTRFDSRLDVKNLLTEEYVCTSESVEPPLNLGRKGEVGLPPKSMWFNRPPSSSRKYRRKSRHRSSPSQHRSRQSSPPSPRTPRPKTPSTSHHAMLMDKIRAIKNIMNDLKMYKHGKKEINKENMIILNKDLQRMKHTYQFTVTGWFAQNPKLYDEIMDADIDHGLKKELRDVISLKKSAKLKQSLKKTPTKSSKFEVL